MCDLINRVNEVMERPQGDLGTEEDYGGIASAAVCKPQREASEETSLDVPGAWASASRAMRKDISVFKTHAVCDSFSCQSSKFMEHSHPWLLLSTEPFLPTDWRALENWQDVVGGFTSDTRSCPHR